MSRTPVETGRFSMAEMSLPRRSASGMPRRRMPTRARSSLPLLFSTISWARRTSVRSISEADISLPLTCRAGLLSVSLMNILLACLWQDDTRIPCLRASCGEEGRNPEGWVKPEITSYASGRRRIDVSHPFAKNAKGWGTHDFQLDLRSAGASQQARSQGASGDGEEEQEQGADCNGACPDPGMALRRHHPGLHTGEYGLCLCRVRRRHALDRQLLPLLKTFHEDTVIIGIHLAGLVENKSIDKQSAAADGKGQPCAHQAGDQANAGAGSECDPCRSLAARIEHHGQPRGCGHPDQTQMSRLRGLAGEHSGGNRHHQSGAQGRLPIDAACIPRGLVPALLLGLSGGTVGRVDQLRQTADRAVAVLGLDSLVATATGDFHTSMSL